MRFGSTSLFVMRNLAGASLLQRYAMLQHALRPYTMTITHAINTMIIFICLCVGGPVIGVSDVNGLRQVILFFTITRFVRGVRRSSGCPRRLLSQASLHCRHWCFGWVITSLVTLSRICSRANLVASVSDLVSVAWTTSLRLRSKSVTSTNVLLF